MKKITTLLLLLIASIIQAQVPVFLKNIDIENAYVRDFLEMNNKSYFIGNGKQLWVTEGATANTQLVKEFDLTVSTIGVHNGKMLLYTGNDLWVSDGTLSGTQFLKSGFTYIERRSIAIAGNNLFFLANTSEQGREWWVTDGTAAGTHITKDINPGTNGQSVSLAFMSFDDKLFFYGVTAASGPNEIVGAQLWVSDGTETGTYALTMSDFPSTTLVNYNFMEFNDKLYFTFHSTVSGTHIFKDLIEGDNDGWPSFLTVIDGKLLFIGYSDSLNGQYLWSTDGTPENTIKIKKVGRVGSDGEMILMNGKLYFEGVGPEGIELWVTDGTVNGTHILKDIRPGASGSDPVCFTVSGNKLFFYASDGSTGNELWVTDGTSEGTNLVKDIFPGTSGSKSTAIYLNSMHNLGNKVYFTARTSVDNFHLFVSDGTAAGTMPVQPVDADNSNSPLGLGSGTLYASSLFKSYGVIYFQAKYTDQGVSLYRVGSQVLDVDKNKLQSVKIYPNPVRDILTIEGVDDIETVRVYNTLGQHVHVLKNDDIIDMSSLQAGWYIVEVICSKGKFTQKVIKQ